MQILIQIFLLHIFVNSLTICMGQWCNQRRVVLKTKIQNNHGQRLVTKKNFFGGVAHKYEPYVYTTIQYYTDYEPVTVCCNGYTKVNDTKCEPICWPPCPSNSYCYRPGYCSCNEGYRGYAASSLQVHCEPVCESSCEGNASCVASNECACNDGFSDNGDGICKPVCNTKCPENSKCFAPNQCACIEGYLDNGLGECQPVCFMPCPPYSECSRPESCTCLSGYEMKNNICQPICNQICPANSQCIRPNECNCEDGYEKRKIEGDTNDGFQCFPKCENSCPSNALCTKPNNCECVEGYVRIGENLCEAICADKCPDHSKCMEPNKCTCLEGYKMLNETCQALCDKPCPENALCTEPNKCQCKAGYQLKLSSIYNLYCEPVCRQNCSTFGKCVAPNKCECLEGYEMDETEVCQPICSKGCENGLCFRPEICICHAGYLMGPKNVCEPVCSMACQNGSCIEPEICKCHEGYRLQDNSVNICEPYCERECINGICVAPNVCICRENYEHLHTEHGLDHHNCQLQLLTTSTFTELSSEQTTNIELNSILTAFPPDQLKETKTTLRLQDAHACNEQCLCWQEFDEYGILDSPKCTHLCLDNHDKPCLDLEMCQCDVSKTQLICRSFIDKTEPDDDPLYYKCKIPRLASTTTTTFTPLGTGKSSDMKSIQNTEEEAHIPWTLISIISTVTLITIMGIVIYRTYSRTRKEPIMEYEL